MKNSTINFVKYTIKQVKNFYKLEIVSFFLTIGFSLSAIVTPYFTRYLIDVFSQNNSLSDVWFIMLAFLTACFLQPVFSFFNVKITKKISEEIVLKVRHLLFNNVIKAPLQFFYKNSSGSIISRLVDDSSQFGAFLSSSIAVVFQDILFIIFILIGMFSLSIKITISLCVLLSIYTAFNLFFNKKFERSSEEILKNNDDFYKVIKQSVDSIEEIKTTQQEKNAFSIFSNSAKNLYNNKLKFCYLYNFVNNINANMGIISVTLIYLVGFYLVSKGEFTLGSVIAFDIYFQMIIPSIRELLSFNSSYHEMKPVVFRLEEYFNIDSEQQISSCIRSDNKTGVLFDNVTFRYDGDTKNQVILNNFSFKFNSPGLYGIVGKSGVGKSTIAKIIVGLYRPTFGNIKIGFEEENFLNIRDNVGYASQNMKLFYDTTIMYNITLGNKNIPEEDVYLICEKLNLHSKISKLPNGYDELVNEKVNFSGGEVQRIILARVCLQKKAINVFDEITSALDVTNTKIVKTIIDDMAKSSLVILLTHNIKLLDQAVEIIKL